MEPTLQFDSANLSIWYRPLAEEESLLIDETARAALMGDHKVARDRVCEIEDVKLRTRCAHMLSAVVHEQRHFVDVLLTNFGQFQIRQFTTFLTHTPEVLKIAKPDGRLGIPITVYGDAVKRSLLGIKEHEFMSKLAENVRSRAGMLQEQARETALSEGTISFGGPAQLESLAYQTQICLLHNEFGIDVARAVHEDMPDQTIVHNRYAWSARLGKSLGLIPPPTEAPPDCNFVLAPPICALLYGALMTRLWGQKQTEVPGGGHSGSALHRLAALILRLESTKALARATCTREAWQVVDQTCADIFGRSAREELQHDIDFNERFNNRVLEMYGGNENSVMVQFLRGVHAARLQLVALLDESPEILLDPNRYGELVSAIEPVPIFVHPDGTDTDVSDGWSNLWMGRSKVGEVREFLWSWAKAPAGLVSASNRIHIVRDLESWQCVVAELIPTAKLLLQGRRQPLVLGPEIDHAEIDLRNRGIEARFDPLFKAPIIDTSCNAFWYWTRRESASCDSCSTLLARGSGYYVPAALFRLNDRIARWVVEKYGGGEFALYFVRKNWRGWMICDDCYAEIEALTKGISRNQSREIV